MLKNKVHGQVGELNTSTLGVGHHIADHEQKSEIFQAQYPKRYRGKASTEVNPMIAGMMQN